MSTQIRLICLLLLGSQAVRAQTEKGVNWWSGGLTSRTNQTALFQNLGDQSSLDLTLTQGSFVRTNLLAGADIQYVRTRDLSRRGLNFDAVTDARTASVGVTPFVRRFWGKQMLRGYVGGGLAVTYGRNRLLTANTQQRGSEENTDSWQVAPEVQAGLLYLINAHWGLDLNARSSVVPLVFNNITVGLVVLTGVKGRPEREPRKTPTQLLTGNWLVGGTFLVSSQKRTLTSATEQTAVIQSQTTQTISFRPSVGYMAGKRWVVGVSVPISSQTVSNSFLRATVATSGGGSDVITRSIGIEPFVKKYISRSRFGPYVGARGGWQMDRVTGSAGEQTARYTINASGGLAYLLGNRFIAEAELVNLGHQWSNTTVTNEARSQTDFAVTLRPALALTYVFW